MNLLNFKYLVHICWNILSNDLGVYTEKFSKVDNAKYSGRSLDAPSLVLVREEPGVFHIIATVACVCLAGW